MEEREHDWRSYQSRLWHWNEHHKEPGAAPEPDYDRIRGMMVH